MRVPERQRVAVRVAIPGLRLRPFAHECGDQDIVVLEVILLQDDDHLVARLRRTVLDEPRVPEPLGPLGPDDFVRVRCRDADGFSNDSVERDLLDEKLPAFCVDASECGRQKPHNVAVDVRVVPVVDRLARRQRHSDVVHRSPPFWFEFDCQPKLLAERGSKDKEQKELRLAIKPSLKGGTQSQSLSARTPPCNNPRTCNRRSDTLAIQLSKNILFTLSSGRHSLLLRLGDRISKEVSGDNMGNVISSRSPY